MARIRTLKPEFWTDEKMSLLDPLTRLVFLGLISLADDAGRVVDNVKLIDGQLFPNTDDSARESLDILARLSRITRYTTASGQRVIQIVGWDKHQKVDKPSKHCLPGPEEAVVVQPVVAADITPALATSSRESRESLAKHSRSDLGPRTMDRGPRTGERSDADASAVETSAPPAEPPAWLVLHAEWETRVGPVDKGRFRKAFRPICEPEGGRELPAPLPILRRALERYAARHRKTREWAFVKPEQFVAGFREHLDVARMPADDFVKLLPLASGAA
jgi:hypothetical protein